MYIEVAFPIPARQLFTYAIPEPLRGKILPGCRLYAQLGNRKSLGFAVNLLENPPGEIQNLKPVLHVVDEEPLFGPELLRFLHWTADYYMASLGETFSAAYPFSPATRPRMVKVVLLDDHILASEQVPDAVQKPIQRRVIEFLIHRKTLLSPADISRELGVYPSTLKTLEKHGWLRIESREQARVPQFAYKGDYATGLVLTPDQEQALALIERSLRQPSPKPILIQGITGSGKTEIYLRAIETGLRLGKTALVLIPEISLTPQTMDRFRSRFGDRVGILHSGLGQGERYDEWRMARQGDRPILVGTRSAIFAPLENPGLIIVDEEHDSSYKQSDPSPRYHARDLAVVRAHLAGTLAVLGSATPSAESAYNVRSGKYEGIELTQRASTHGLPTVHLVDMRGRAGDEAILSRELLEALWDRYENRRQSILFLNRRGFATSLICNHCGHILMCDHCSVALVFHNSQRVLICHHCDARKPPPEYCPACAEKFIRQRGYGTERVVHEVEEKIPGARVVRLDRDTTRQKGEHDRLLAPFRQGESDILVGTQMIAKGLDFPNVTLVGVLNADYALSLPDFRAAERTFTLLTQVAGRAGRGEHPGEVFIQTYCPAHYSIQLALTQDYNAFFEKEIRYRRLIGFPPFSRIVLWRVESTAEDVARGKAWELYSILSAALHGKEGVTLLPPVEAPLYRLRDFFRWQVALKSRSHQAIRALLSLDALLKLLAQRRKDLRVIQDVDPSDML